MPPFVPYSTYISVRQSTVTTVLKYEDFSSRTSLKINTVLLRGETEERNFYLWLFCRNNPQLLAFGCARTFLWPGWPLWALEAQLWQAAHLSSPFWDLGRFCNCWKSQTLFLQSLIFLQQPTFHPDFSCLHLSLPCNAQLILVSKTILLLMHMLSAEMPSSCRVQLTLWNHS